MEEILQKLFIPQLSLKADKPGSIRVEFSTFNVVDLDGDVTVPGAFGNQDVRIQSHGHDTGGWTIGKGTVSESGDKGVLDGLLNLDMIAGKEGYASLKFDLENGTPLQEWSYVFEILDRDFGEFEGRQVRFIKRAKIFSVDPVFLGAGIGTRTSAVKGLYSFDEESRLLATRVEDFVQRLNSRVEMRAKEGRDLSEMNRENLSSLADSLIKAGKTILETAPPDKVEEEIDTLLLKSKLRFQQINSGLSMVGAA